MKQPTKQQLQAYTSYSPHYKGYGALNSKQPSSNFTKTKRPISWRKIVLRIFLLLVVIVLIIIGFLGWKLYVDASKITGDKNPLDLFSLFDPGPLQETDGRVNILLAGNSAGDPGHQGANLTDSIMVISINPTDNTAILLSIPRDMWVNIPGNGNAKINSAYEDGGMSLLSQIVQQDFNIVLDYSALINYAAFKDAVNAVGGITINIKSPDPSGIYDAYTHLQLANGKDTLDGQEALDLARARGDDSAGDVSYGIPDSDFTRTMYQREMLIALKDKAVTAGVITNPLKIASLADAFGNNVKSNLSLGNMIRLYDDTKDIKNSNIQSLNLNDINGQDLVTNYYAPGNEDALIPTAGFGDYNQIQSAIQTILYPPGK
ncbi:MAG: LCP family protein [Candidatus Saccharimonadales bacterium]